MKIYIAEEAGFCFGVKRALNLINELHGNGQEIQILGPLIHNQVVMKELKDKGIDTIHSEDQWNPSKKMVIRTHGIPLEVENNMKLNNVDYIDATCPLVKNTHNIIKKLNPQKTTIIIIGDQNHPEIIAAKSYAKDVIVINSEEEARNITKRSSISIVAQTTLDSDFFKKITGILIEKAKRVEIFNTICDATIVRQEAIKKLAPSVDFVVVIGGNNSSNTKKLYNISRQKNKNTYYFEKSTDLCDRKFLDKVKKFKSVGITAGASTPYEEIEKVKNCFIN